MSSDDVPHPEMLKRPRFHLLARRRFGKRTDALAPQYLQSGEWYDVADLLQAAAAPATASELAGEREIVAAFQREHLDSVSVTARRRTPVRSRMLNSLLTGKIAAALAATVVGATGAATAAYADALPDSVQDIAHHLIAAPPAHSHASDTGRAHGHQFAVASPSPTVSPSPSASDSASPSPSPSDSASLSPSASPSPSAVISLDPAAFGLCTAWSNAVDHNRQDQVGFKSKLAGIAGGDASMSDDDITSFCATVQKSHDGTDSDDASDDASVSPSASPAASATSHDQGDDHGHNGDNHGKGNGGHGNDDAPGHH